MFYKKIQLTILVVLMVLTASAQESKQITIEGQIAKTLIVNYEEIKVKKAITIDSMVVYNHLQQRKGSVKNIRGILLKDILAGVEFTTTSPKLLSEFYLTCVATDNYKVVYSWNELFNTEVGNNTYVVTDYITNGAEEVKGSLSLLTTTDKATGRRFVKGLSKILMQQVK